MQSETTGLLYTTFAKESEKNKIELRDFYKQGNRHINKRWNNHQFVGFQSNFVIKRKTL